MSKRPLQVGDRVRVYGPVFDPGIFDVVSSEEPRTGIVTSVTSLTLHFKDDGRHDELSAYPQQCRRLIPRARKEPRAERKRIERWMNVYEDPKLSATLHHSYATRAECLAAALGNHPRRSVRLVECEPGAVRVTREELEKAWKGHLLPGTTFINGDLFDRFCKALGLPKGGAD